MSRSSIHASSSSAAALAGCCSSACDCCCCCGGGGGSGGSAIIACPWFSFSSSSSSRSASSRSVSMSGSSACAAATSATGCGRACALRCDNCDGEKAAGADADADSDRMAACTGRIGSCVCCARGGSDRVQPLSASMRLSTTKSAEPASVDAEPITTSLSSARVTATLTRRQSRSRSPTFCCALDRTSERITQDFCRPCDRSTVSTSTPGCDCSRSCSRRSCARYGEMTPMRCSSSPEHTSASTRSTARSASTALRTRSPCFVSSAGTASVSRNTTGRLGSSACCSQQRSSRHAGTSAVWRSTKSPRRGSASRPRATAAVPQRRRPP
eukprot:Unigene15142_Nuclearia_a/m.45339 Unigene15142_Nuclearia_a/g.45339  ORF Unigene15142_Nuclearia_a/g.45339 Unigene15142_Nuclearia_a/m.45339 type:complete len:327 (-) Unigene15142_Nuclearia_a:15-995(-)